MEEIHDIIENHKRKIDELVSRIEELENKRHRPNESTVANRDKQKILDQIEKIRSDGTTVAQHFMVQYFVDYINFIVDDIEIGYNDKDEFYLHRTKPDGTKITYDDKSIRGAAILLRGRVLESPAKKDTKKFVSYFIDSSAFSNVTFNTGEGREFWKAMSVYSGKYRTSLVDKEKGEREVGAVMEDSLLLCKGINLNRKPNLLNPDFFTEYTVTKILYVLEFE